MPEEKSVVLFKILGKIDEGLVQVFSDRASVLFRNAKERRETIEPVIMIGSQGGSTEAALIVHAFLKQIPFPITTIGIGMVESAAACIYAAGARRLATPDTTFYLHEGACAANAGASEFPQIVRNLQNRVARNIALTARATGQPLSVVREWFKRGKTFSARQAVKSGIVHQIVCEPYLKGRSITAVWEH